MEKESWIVEIEHEFHELAQIKNKIIRIRFLQGFQNLVGIK